ncbi:MAG: hypothetical protein II393_00130 [Cytophagales bacterium]|nr:hypothetical protein [Cytophagales bacterium]
MARTKLTDKQKKKIVADYIESQNYTQTGIKNKVDTETVRRIVKADKDFARKSEEKKEKDTKDILEYMDTIKEKQKRIIDLSLQALEDKLESPDMFTNVKDIATVYGVIFDKALKYKEIQIKSKENEEAGKQNGVITELISALNKAKENK